MVTASGSGTRTARRARWTSDLAERGVFKVWADRTFFAGVHVSDHGSIAWSNDIELCADALYLNSPAGLRSLRKTYFRRSGAGPPMLEANDPVGGVSGDGPSRRLRVPSRVKSALRDGRLVVFAGAGVSMGEPAHLPDFDSLACKVARGSGESRKDDEPVDRFLGRLIDKGTKVHELAAEVLSGENLTSTALHRDLLRLYSDANRVRIVTTNFDLLFEQAATDLFGTAPDAFRAPALPLGNDFHGIVHVHGTVTRSRDMVLTDVDFGRAYLTEGWARRFLAGLFREFTVLFVGYGHNDTVMNYLARALPATGERPRFVLIGQDELDPQRWKMLGVEPIPYRQSGEHDHAELQEGVARLAELATRGILDWGREISELAKKPPPIGGEEIDVIDEALTDPVKTRFFTEVAILPGWVDWLDKRDELDALFRDGSLEERDVDLAKWLAKRFPHDHADILFLLIVGHDMRLHPRLWWDLGREVGESKRDLQDKTVLSRWISMLLATTPRHTGAQRDDERRFVLLGLGRRCARHGMVDDLLRVFDAMAQSRLSLKRGFAWPDAGGHKRRSSIDAETALIGNYRTLNELWGELKANVSQVAEPLLGRLVKRLEEQYVTLRAWQQASPQWEPVNFHRSAIEPHDQERLREPVDVIIDAARDCLEWLAGNDVGAAARWCDQLARADAPLLRRLAAHGIYSRADLSPDAKIHWLCTNTNIHDVAAHHEIFRVAHQAYPESSTGRRKKFLEAVLAYRWPKEDDPDRDGHTSYCHFNWLYWLHTAAPGCDLVKQRLDEVRARYPEFKPREGPDFGLYFSSRTELQHQSPWTANELLARSAAEWVPQLLAFRQSDVNGPDPIGLLEVIQDAATRKFEWGIDLADALADAGAWAADFWRVLLRAWPEMELDEIQCRRVIERMTSTELYSEHARDTAEAIRALARGGNARHLTNLLPLANSVASALWRHLYRGGPPDEPEDRLPLDLETRTSQRRDWLRMADSHTAGVLADYWLRSLSAWRQQQDPAPDALTGDYRVALSEIVQDRTLAGTLGRSILASQFPFLAAADEVWTRENLVPCFGMEHGAEEFQAAWDGFLWRGSLDPAVAELMEEPIRNAVRQIRGELAGREERFVQYYTSMVGSFVADPLSDWIPLLFEHGDEKTRLQFAHAVEEQLRGMTGDERRVWWRRWLKRYWEGRLQGVPVALDPSETEPMLEWLPLLSADFPEAVELAIRMPVTPVQRGTLIYYLHKPQLSRQGEAMARLLIWLGGGVVQLHMWHHGRELIDDVLETDLSSELERGLKELVAKLDL